MSDLQTVEKFFAAVEAGDLAAVRSLYSPDAQIWHNDTDSAQSVSDNLKVLSGLHSVLAGLRYEVVRRVPVPGGVFQQHVLRGELPDGTRVAMPAAMYLAIADDRITRVEEYLDSAQAAPVRAARGALAAANSGG